MNYVCTATDAHQRDEEMQWARILSTGDSARGMVLLLVQKLCTAFHEYEPAFRADAIDAAKVHVFRDRLARRIEAVLDAMRANGLDVLDGHADLGRFLESVRAVASASELADMTETVHQFGHRLCDALEGKGLAQ